MYALIKQEWLGARGVCHDNDKKEANTKRAYFMLNKSILLRFVCRSFLLCAMIGLGYNAVFSLKVLLCLPFSNVHAITSSAIKRSGFIVFITVMRRCLRMRCLVMAAGKK